MRNRLINDATSLVKQLPGQSRYWMDVHGCTEFLDVLNFRSMESLSQPGGMTWRSPAPLRILPATHYC